MPEERTVAFFGLSGAGRATTLGNLIYKCGGIDLVALQRLEKSGDSGYGKAWRALQQSGDRLYFYTPKYEVNLVDPGLDEDISAAAALIVLSPEQVLNDEAANMPPGIRKLFDQGKVVFLINNFGVWDEATFKAVSERISAIAKQTQAPARLPIVPVSGLHGTNLMETSTDMPWYSSTAVAELDKII